MAVKSSHSLLFCLFVTCVISLKLGAFNIQVFGTTKASKQDVMGILARIAVRYDIVLIQEIRDSTGQAILKLLNRIKTEYGVDMMMEISDRLGRTRSKEQYAFLYRNDLGVSVIDSFHFDDGNETTGEDLFQREPFVVRFQALNCEVEDFTLVALHTSPSMAVEELTALSQVVSNINETWQTADIMILGDLNADCRYVSSSAWSGIPLRQDSDFLWLIPDEVDTTVSSTDCAYDRFIITGDSLKAALVPGSAQPFLFHMEYGLNDTQAKAVSDHYPIELELRDKSPTTNAMEWVTSVTTFFSTLPPTSAPESTTIPKPTSAPTPTSAPVPTSDPSPTTLQTPTSASPPTTIPESTSATIPTTVPTPTRASPPTTVPKPTSIPTPTSAAKPAPVPKPISAPTLISSSTLLTTSTLSPTSSPPSNCATLLISWHSQLLRKLGDLGQMVAETFSTWLTDIDL